MFRHAQFITLNFINSRRKRWRQKHKGAAQGILGFEQVTKDVQIF
jgi:hypothetical protein